MPGNDLSKLLLALPGVKDGEIPIQSLECLGLLWCGGTAKEKGESLFKMINPAG